MARQRLALDVNKARQERAILEVIIADQAGDENMRKRAKLIVALADGAELANAADSMINYLVSGFGGKFLNILLIALLSFLMFLLELSETESVALPRQRSVWPLASAISTTSVPCL